MAEHEDAPRAGRDGFVSGEPRADEDVDLRAPVGTPEYERAQER